MFEKINCGIVAYENSDEIIKKKIIQLFDNSVIEYNYDELFKYSYRYLSKQLEDIYAKRK